MDCPQCQHANPAGALFCNACGAKLEVVCPACSQVNPPGSRLCNACGHNLAQPPAPAASVAAPSSSLELATQTDSRKHVARAQRLQGDILAASGRLEEAVQALATSVHLAEHIQMPHEVRLGRAALGKGLAQLGRDQEAEAQLIQATQTIEAIAANLQTPRLHHSFLNAVPVLEVYAALGHQPPSATL